MSILLFILQGFQLGLDIGAHSVDVDIETGIENHKIIRVQIQALCDRPKAINALLSFDSDVAEAVQFLTNSSGVIYSSTV